MLTELRIKNFAIIESLTLPLAPGFNVLSGETGAGKSIIVGALGLLLGERASGDLIRTGADRAVVEGVFDIAGHASAALVALTGYGQDLRRSRDAGFDYHLLKPISFAQLKELVLDVGSRRRRSPDTASGRMP